MQADPEAVCMEGTTGSHFYMKGEEYSLSKTRFQKEQVESSRSVSLLHPHVGKGSIFDYIQFSSELSCSERHYFYYVNNEKG